MAMHWSPEDWARVGKQLRTWREANGFSRRELSERAGVSEKSIQLAEEGRVPKGRWPQSLTAIERALGFPLGRIENMLDSADEPHVYDDPVVVRDGKPVVIDAKTMEPAPWFSLEHHGAAPESDEDVPASPTYPSEIEEALPAIMFFASNCVAHGAPEWLGAAYENAVAALLKSLEGPPLGQQSAPPGERVTRERAGYSTEHPGYSASRRYDSTQAALGGNYNEITKVGRQAAQRAAMLRSIGQQEDGQQLLRQFGPGPRIIRAITQQNEAYQRMLAKLSAPAQQAAALDLINRLKPIVEVPETEAGEASDGPAS